MTEPHDHPQVLKYTIYFVDRYWWGGRIKRTVYGNGSGQKEGEFIIKQEKGFLSLNYARIRCVEAEIMPHEH